MVVGKVLSMVRHPNSDHMWICQVDVGGDAPVQIVTGAQNVHAGRSGSRGAARLPGCPAACTSPRASCAGEVSNGMLCSCAELGLTLHDFPYVSRRRHLDSRDEDCTLGEDINLVIGNDDTVVDFEITNNRPDCLQHHRPCPGSCRRLRQAHASPRASWFTAADGRVDMYDHLDVDVPHTKLCHRYTAPDGRATSRSAPPPSGCASRLRANGVRPINNIVDITNYVMLEYGQPMHAFDYRYVSAPARSWCAEAEDGRDR